MPGEGPQVPHLESEGFYTPLPQDRIDKLAGDVDTIIKKGSEESREELRKKIIALTEDYVTGAITKDELAEKIKALEA